MGPNTLVADFVLNQVKLLSEGKNDLQTYSSAYAAKASSSCRDRASCSSLSTVHEFVCLCCGGSTEEPESNRDGMKQRRSFAFDFIPASDFCKKLRFDVARIMQRTSYDSP